MQSRFHPRCLTLFKFRAPRHSGLFLAMSQLSRRWIVGQVHDQCHSRTAELIHEFTWHMGIQSQLCEQACSRSTYYFLCQKH
jgi:hypothetical protein